MELYPTSRQFYTLELASTDSTGATITPAGYDASFDGGSTWKAGTLDVASGFWQWLVSGVNAPTVPGGYTDAAVLSHSIRPMIRVTDSPETVVTTAPYIRVP